MSPKAQKGCNHTRFSKKCRSCRALQARWYQRLKDQGFVDIEYGLEHPQFIAHVPDPSTPGALEAQAFYDEAWRVYHEWVAAGRSRRDCRIAELFASQQGDSGTVRGIARALRAENLPPWSPGPVQETLREIRKELLSGKTHEESEAYVHPRHAAA